MFRVQNNRFVILKNTSTVCHLCTRYEYWNYSMWAFTTATPSVPKPGDPRTAACEPCCYSLCTWARESSYCSMWAMLFPLYLSQGILVLQHVSHAAGQPIVELLLSRQHVRHQQLCHTYSSTTQSKVSKSGRFWINITFLISNFLQILSTLL